MLAYVKMSTISVRRNICERLLMGAIGYSTVGEAQINEQLEWDLMQDDCLDKNLTGI